MKQITVSNITSNSGNQVANQFEITNHRLNIVYFQSYDSTIVAIHR